MQLHELKPIHKKKEKKRIGRGGKRGTYSGKGIKGQKSRAGAKFQPEIRQFIKRYPKKRGYKFKSIKPDVKIVNTGILEKKFDKDAKINPETLFKAQLVRRINGNMPLVKILGKGELTKSLIIENCEVSKGAKEKIEKAGGTIEIPISKSQ